MTSIVVIWGLTIWMIYEAILRVITKPKVDGKIMMITAVFGLCVNLIMMKSIHERPEGAGSFGGHSHAHGGGHAHGPHGGEKKKKKASANGTSR